MPVTVADLDVLRERLERALDAVEDMTRALIADRAGAQPDAYAAAGSDVTPGITMAEAVEDVDHLYPMEVTGWAIVRRCWAVRVPIADADGEIDGVEIMEFPTKAEAEAFVASAEAA